MHVAALRPHPGRPPRTRSLRLPGVERARCSAPTAPGNGRICRRAGAVGGGRARCVAPTPSHTHARAPRVRSLSSCTRRTPAGRRPRRPRRHRPHRRRGPRAGRRRRRSAWRGLRAWPARARTRSRAASPPARLPRPRTWPGSARRRLACACGPFAAASGRAPCGGWGCTRRRLHRHPTRAALLSRR